MADIQADANDVITVLSEKIAALSRENAVLHARLYAAMKQVNESEPQPEEPSKSKARS